MMDWIRGILTGGVFFMLYAFAVFCVVVSLAGGIADIIYHSRQTAAQEERAAEAARGGEEFHRVDYTPNLAAGLASLVLFPVSAVLVALVLMGRLSVLTHVMVIAATAIAGFIFFLPRPPLGTGTEHMREVFAYLLLLGIFESALYRTYVYRPGRNSKRDPF